MVVGVCLFEVADAPTNWYVYIEIAEADNLTDIDVFLMILVRAITLPKVSLQPS